MNSLGHLTSRDIRVIQPNAPLVRFTESEMYLPVPRRQTAYEVRIKTPENPTFSLSLPASLPVEIRSNLEEVALGSTEVYQLLVTNRKRTNVLNLLLSVCDDGSNVGRVVFGNGNGYDYHKFLNASVIAMAFPVDPSNFKYVYSVLQNPGRGR